MVESVEVIIKQPGQADRVVRLQEGATRMGRAEDNEVVLSDVGVSRRHAQVYVSRGEVTVEDLGSDTLSAAAAGVSVTVVNTAGDTEETSFGIANAVAVEPGGATITTTTIATMFWKKNDDVLVMTQQLD